MTKLTIQIKLGEKARAFSFAVLETYDPDALIYEIKARIETMLSRDFKFGRWKQRPGGNLGGRFNS